MKAIIEEFQQATWVKPISDAPETFASFNERRIEYLDALAKWLIKTKIKSLQDEVERLKHEKQEACAELDKLLQRISDNAEQDAIEDDKYDKLEEKNQDFLNIIGNYEKVRKQIDRIAILTPEECDDMYEGSEVCDDTDACEDFEQNSER